MIRFESTRKLAYRSFGAGALIVLVFLNNLQKPMIDTTTESNLMLAIMFFLVIGVTLLTVAKDLEESIHLIYTSHNEK